MARWAKVVPGKVLQLKVSLLEVEPTVWRSLVVPSDITLAKLHRILQIAMGWTGSHMQLVSPNASRVALGSGRFLNKCSWDGLRVLGASVQQQGFAE